MGNKIVKIVQQSHECDYIYKLFCEFKYIYVIKLLIFIIVGTKLFIMQ